MAANDPDALGHEEVQRLVQLATQSGQTFQALPPAPLDPNLVLGELLALIKSLRQENAALVVALADAQGRAGDGDMSSQVSDQIYRAVGLKAGGE